MLNLLAGYAVFVLRRIQIYELDYSVLFLLLPVFALP